MNRPPDKNIIVAEIESKDPETLHRWLWELKNKIETLEARIKVLEGP